MDGFDPLTMQYLATPMSLGGDGSGVLGNPLLAPDFGDHHSNFDADTYTASDDGFAPHPALSAHHSVPMLKQFNSTYEDPVSDIVSNYELPDPSSDPNMTAGQAPETPSIDRDNKLLSFSLPIYNYALLDYTYQRASISLTAQLHGMFFLAESPWGPTSDAAPPPAELTCYRRNLFQISGSITLPRALRYILTDTGEQIPIVAQDLSISATESVENNAVKIISVPWKTGSTNASGSANPAAPTAPPTPNTPEEKTEREPPSIPLDMTISRSDSSSPTNAAASAAAAAPPQPNSNDPTFATFPISWKRLQFRIATANNGRRKELQQHFVVRLKVVASLATGQKISIAEAHSGAIIVRGRSPRNFQSRKEFPVGGAGSVSGRKGSASAANAAAAVQQQQQQGQQGLPRPRTSESAQQQQQQQQQRQGHGQAPQQVLSNSMKRELSNHNNSNSNHGFDFSGYDDTGLHLSHDFLDWKTSPHDGHGHSHNHAHAINNGAMTALPPDTFQLPQHGLYAQSSPDFSRAGMPQSSPPPEPINLSLMDEEPKRPSHTTGTTTTTTADTPTKPPKLRQQQQQQQQQSSSSAAWARSSFSLNGIGSPDESADLLYEYFPLGLDDWMPPVDAVYRPHVVHHIKSQPDPKAQTAKTRSKRYFSEDNPA